MKCGEKQKMKVWAHMTKGMMACAIFLALFYPVYASAIELSKEQKELVDKLGYPDTFTLVLAEEDIDTDKIHRLEMWNYYQLTVGFNFVDGNLVSAEDLEDFTVLTLLPKMYRPEQFENGMSWKELKKTIIGKMPYGKVDIHKDILPDAELVGSEQLLLGFVEGRLVYVETLPLSLEDEVR